MSRQRLNCQLFIRFADTSLSEKAARPKRARLLVTPIRS
jgi:hypothetical protein